MLFKKIVLKKLSQLFRLPDLIKYFESRNYHRSRQKKFPEFKWKSGAHGPEKRVEASRIQVGSKLYVFGGYITLATVSRRVDLYDMQTNQWKSLGLMPEDTPQTHNGAVYDGENHIFLIGGQLGGHCSPVSKNCYAFNLSDYSWKKMPPLPAGRYMPLAHFYKGRIHCLSGTDTDRISPTYNHWSLEIHNGQTTEMQWREDPPISKARTHTASQIIANELFVFGGQQGDIPAIDGDPNYQCNFDTPMDIIMDEVCAFHLETGECRQLAPMPVKISHTEYAIVRVGSKIIIAGGIFNRQAMSDIILSYDIENDHWQTIGRLPFSMKSKAVGYWNKRLYLITGQRSKSETDLRAGQVLNTVWYADLPPSFFS